MKRECVQPTRDCSLKIAQGVIDIDRYAAVSNLMRFNADPIFLVARFGPHACRLPRPARLHALSIDGRLSSAAHFNW